MANEEVRKLTETESNSRVIRLMKRIGELAEKSTIRESNNLVAFVGPTKSGKSTLINCLLGTKLICKMDEGTEESFIIKANDNTGPKIGGSGESETESPQCCGNIPDSDFQLWDFAGFGDNKGTEQEIVNAISYQTILLGQNSVRFVLVVPCYMIKNDDPLPFYKLLVDLHTICPEIADSLCIVFTKFDKGNVKILLENATKHTFEKAEQENIEIINKGKMIIEKILEKKNYIDFKAPEMNTKEDEKEFTLPNKQQFIDCITKLKGTKVKDFPLVISEQAKHVIAELYTVFYQMVKNEVENMNYLIEKYIQYQIDEILEAEDETGNPTDATSKLNKFLEGKSTIEDIIEKSTDFKTFIAEIEKLKIENKINLESIQKFRFTENLKNMYKINDKEVSSCGELEFFSNIKVTLKAGAKIFCNLISNSIAATEEEKKKEKEWAKKNQDEITTLKEQIENLKFANNSIQVKLTEELINMVQQHANERQQMEKYLKEQCALIDKIKNDVNYLLFEKQQLNQTLQSIESEKETLKNQLASEKINNKNYQEKAFCFQKELNENQRNLNEMEASKFDIEKELNEKRKFLKETEASKLKTEKQLNEKTKESNAKWSCVVSLVKDIHYYNPLLNMPLLLKSFSDLYGTKALSNLISLTEVLSEDSSESLQEIYGSPHALKMLATMVGLC